MALPNNQTNDLTKLVTELDKDRAWILEQLDKGRWPDLRIDLASLERDLGQFLSVVYEKMEDQP